MSHLCVCERGSEWMQAKWDKYVSMKLFFHRHKTPHVLDTVAPQWLFELLKLSWVHYLQWHFIPRCLLTSEESTFTLPSTNNHTVHELKKSQNVLIAQTRTNTCPKRVKSKVPSKWFSSFLPSWLYTDDRLHHRLAIFRWAAISGRINKWWSKHLGSLLHKPQVKTCVGKHKRRRGFALRSCQNWVVSHRCSKSG